MSRGVQRSSIGPSSLWNTEPLLDLSMPDFTCLWKGNPAYTPWWLSSVCESKWGPSSTFWNYRIVSVTGALDSCVTPLTPVKNVWLYYCAIYSAKLPLFKISTTLLQVPSTKLSFLMKTLQSIKWKGSEFQTASNLVNSITGSKLLLLNYF